jgi:hypothetical protein
VDVYRVTIRNPSANPEPFEIQYIDADDEHDADLQARDIVADHPVSDVALVSVELVEPGQLYHDSL